jgi:two-component system sensor histidine kinase KdpD
LAGVLAFDVFFVSPVFHLSVEDVRYLVTFAVFLLVSVTTGTMAERLRYKIEESRIRENRTRALYYLAKDMAAVTDIGELGQKMVEQVAKTVDGEAVIYTLNRERRLEIIAASNSLSEMVVNPNETAVANWAYLQEKVAGLGTDTLPGSYGIYFPLVTEQVTLGVMGIRPREQYMTPDQRYLVETVCGLVALAIGRLNLAAEAQEMKQLEKSEKLRTALFNSISHDLRTPLSSIIGAVSSLLEEGDLYGPKERRTLLETIKKGAGRMNRVVGNLLDLARLESGMMRLHQDWYEIQDLIGVALRQGEELLKDHKVTVKYPPYLPMAQFDFALMEQVLANLLDNAVKYSPEGSEIDIAAEADAREVKISVADRGTGIPPGDEEKVFDKFYRLHSPRHVSGTGLGLSICKGIVEAHGGRIWSENRSEGGSIATFTLPITGGGPRPNCEGE